AGRMRTARSPIEPDGNPRVDGVAVIGPHHDPLEGVLEQTHIALRRSKEHRDLVERNAPRRLLDDAADDLHRLAPLAGRGEETDVPRPFTFGWTLTREQVAPQRHEIARPRLFEHLG